MRISGFEEWKFGDDGLVAESKGHYDQAEYERQLAHGSAERSQALRFAPLRRVPNSLPVLV